MWKTLQRNYGLYVSQECVRMMLKQADPVGVANRRHRRLNRRTYSSKGPNHTWHIDGYDKLRTYGFCISGCIDGFSRKIMWLECGYTNHDPAIIAGYYLRCVKDYGGLPEVCRTDCGTENVSIAAIQAFLARNDKAHKYGTSPGNQRIESWWSFFRHNRSQWWIEQFEELVRRDIFQVGNDYEVEVLRFCFMMLLQKDLNEVKRAWNMHRIRPSNGARCPAGIPDELYYLPPAGYCDCIMPLNYDDIPDFIKQETKQNAICEDADFYDYLTHLCQHNGWATEPTSAADAINLYCNIIRCLHCNGTIR